MNSNSTLYIHLSKLDQNLQHLNSIFGNEVQHMAVVKDNAYGHGVIPIAQFLTDKVDWFCVATLEEAIELREADITNEILVFEIPKVGEEEAYKTHDLTATIADLSVFDRLKPQTKCHLNFDTGMRRLGMLPGEAGEALQQIENYSKLNYTGIYTHFANADGDSAPTVSEQVKLFQSIRNKFPSHLMTHTSNSAGVLYHHQKTVFDAVRTGIALYGYAPGVEDLEQLQPIVEWKSHLVQVKKIKKGQAVGYGSRWEAPKDGYIGIVPIGYGDGVFRSLSGKINVEIESKLFPQVGTISMDYMAVFLGGTKMKEGEEVTILRDGELSAKKWAKWSDTISYEITTTIAPKVKRVYLDQ